MALSNHAICNAPRAPADVAKVEAKKALALDSGGTFLDGRGIRRGRDASSPENSLDTRDVHVAVSRARVIEVDRITRYALQG